MKRKEIIWMLLPCLFLLGAGWYFMRKPERKLGVAIESAEVLSLSPRQASQGFDTTFRVKTLWLNFPHSNKPLNSFLFIHQNFKLTYVEHGSEKEVPRSEWSCRVWSMKDRDSDLIYVAKLRDVPLSRGPLTLKIIAYGVRNEYPDKLTRITERTAKTSLLLRRAGQRISRPRPNKKRPFRLDKPTVFWYHDAFIRNSKTFVTLHFSSIDSSITPREFIETTTSPSCLVTEKRTYPDGWCIYRSISKLDGRTGEISFWVDTTHLPQKTRNLSLKTQISLKECWPLPISVVLRKDGKNITSSEATPLL